MAKNKTKGTPSTVKTGQDITDRLLDEEYAETAVDWWDVRRPEVYFGVQGQRTDEQKDLVKRFRQEWSGGTGSGARGGANAVNAFIEGRVTADQLSSNWGSENLQAIIKASEYSTNEFSGNPEDFGAYLQSEWDALSEFTESTATGPDGSLGSLSGTPLQISGDKGRLSADDLAQGAFWDSIREAAEQAGVPLDVEGPSNSQYELNVGQFEDSPLGSYVQTQRPNADLGDFVEAGVKVLLSMALTGGLIGGIKALAAGTSAVAGVGAGITGAFQNLASLGSTLAGTPSGTDILLAMQAQASGGPLVVVGEAAGSLGALATLENAVSLGTFITQVQSDETIENPESIINDEEITNTVLTDGVEAGLNIVENLQQ